MSGDPQQAAIRKFAHEEPPSLAPLDVLLRYATDPPLAVETLLHALEPAAVPGECIAELGFGGGWLLDEMVQAFPDVRLLGLDLSAGSARGVRARHGARIDVMLGDMQRLPFDDGSLSAVATCWTLYFMRDIDGALAEIRRCLAPGGVMVAATTAPDHMLEFQQLADQAQRGIGREPEQDIAFRFDTQTGAAAVRRHFPDAELREWDGELTVTDAEPLMVLWPGYGPQSLPPDEHAAATAEFERLVRARIARDGLLRITRHDGAFVARR